MIRFGSMCQFCKQSTQHPLPQESDWMDKDWNGEKTKVKKIVGETNVMSEWDPDSKQEQIDKINIDRLNLDPDNPRDEVPQIANSLIPPSHSRRSGEDNSSGEDRH